MVVSSVGSQSILVKERKKGKKEGKKGRRERGEREAEREGKKEQGGKYPWAPLELFKTSIQ